LADGRWNSAFEQNPSAEMTLLVNVDCLVMSHDVGLLRESGKIVKMFKSAKGRKQLLHNS
jgi:hypothetical protein